MHLLLAYSIKENKSVYLPSLSIKNHWPANLFSLWRLKKLTEINNLEFISSIDNTTTAKPSDSYVKLQRRNISRYNNNNCRIWMLIKYIKAIKFYFYL